MTALTLCLAGAALAGDLPSVGDPDSLGFLGAAIGAHDLLV